MIDDPIFILGMGARTGTHFLQDLLCLHPHCARATVKEDYFTAEAAWLRGFVDAMRGRGKFDPHGLLPFLGRGLLDYIRQPRDGFPAVDGQRLVAKTPSVNNLPAFFDLFPNARLLLLTRDGRDKVESGVRSWGRDTSYEAAMRYWAAAARSLLRFIEDPANQGRAWQLVRYEDLVLNLRPTLERILAFAGLPLDLYDFEAAANLPVRGSSDLRAAGQVLHWTPVEKPLGFKPLERWRDWPRARHERYAWIAGPAAARLGYPPCEFPSTPLTRLGWRLYNHTLDARHLLSRGLAGLPRRLGRLLRLALRGTT